MGVNGEGRGFPELKLIAAYHPKLQLFHSPCDFPSKGSNSNRPKMYRYFKA
jgi:hypothetical protein